MIIGGNEFKLKIVFKIFLFTIPFQFYFPAIKGINLSLSRVLALILFIWWLIIEGKKNKFSSLKSSKLTLPVLVFLSVMIISTFFSFNFQNSFYHLLKWSSLLLVFFVGEYFFQEEKMIKSSLKIIFFTGILVSLIGIVQCFFGVGKLYEIIVNSQWVRIFLEADTLEVKIATGTFNWYPIFRSFGVFVDSNIFAIYLGICLFCLVQYYQFYKNKYDFSFYFLFSLFTIVLILTFSRAGWLGFLAMMIYFGLRQKYLRKNLIQVISTIIFAVLISISFPQIRLLITERIVDILPAIQVRIELWKDSILNFLINPFWGTGLGNYLFPLPAHNNFLQIAGETGILGLISFLWIIVRAFKTAKNPLLEGFLIWFCIQSLFHSFFWVEKFNMFFWIILGFLENINKCKRQNKKSLQPQQSS